MTAPMQRRTEPRARRRRDAAFAALAETLTYHVAHDHPPHTVTPRAPARRDAHPKHHGCVAATFEVLDGLPPSLRRGLFAAPRTFQAEVRFSNAFKVRHDCTRDARGMAIKVHNPPGQPVRLPEIAVTEHTLMPEGVATQDFLLVTHSEFFAATASEFVEIVTALLAARGVVGRMVRLARCFFGVSPCRFRWRNFKALIKTNTLTSNPLFLSYFSQTPYRYGLDLDEKGSAGAAKFCVRPLQAPTLSDRVGLLVKVLSFSIGAGGRYKNFLEKALHRYLAREDAEFEFCVQLRPAPPYGRPRDDRMPLDNAAYPWAQDAAPFVPVARVRIPHAQRYADAELVQAEMERGEHLTFSPWHAIRDHRPLGSINRARLFVYARVSQMRHRLNETTAHVSGGGETRASHCVERTG